MAFFDTAVYSRSVGYSAVTAWASGTKPSGAIRRPTAATAGNERVFVLIGGASSTTEPTWPTTRGGSVAEGGATWREITGTAGFNGDLTNCPTYASCRAQLISVGAVIKSTDNTKLLICTTQGTAGSGGEPAWNGAIGGTVSDGTAVWTTANITAGSIAAWSAPFNRFETASVQNGAAGITHFLGDDHTQTQASSLTISSATGTIASPINVLSIDHTLSLPVSGCKSGAQINTTGSNSITLGLSYVYWNGITFNAGSGVNANASLSMTGNYNVFENCQVQLGQSGASAIGNIQPNDCIFINTPMSFGGAGTTISLTGNFKWRNTPNAVGGNLPTNRLFLLNGANVQLDGVDISAFAGSNIVAINGVGGCFFYAKMCKINASPSRLTNTVSREAFVEFVDCDSGGNVWHGSYDTYQGTKITETGVVRTSGATDTITPQSHNLSTTSAASFTDPFFSHRLAIWNGTTGTNRNVTVYGIANQAALPNNDDIWIESMYHGDSGSPQGSAVTSSKADVLSTGSALSADTSAWDSQLAARANSSSYAVGAAFKVASNPGRAFFVVSGSGNTAASEPGGYISAVDGGTITDGGYTVRAGVRFSMATVLSSPQPQLAGLIYVQPKVGKASTGPIYIDPQPVLS